MIGLSAFAVPVTSSDEGLAVYILAWISIGFGVFLVFSSRTITWSFDKENGNLLINEKFLLSKKVTEYSLQDISEVKLDSKVADSDGKELLGNRFGVKLVLSHRQHLHLCPDLSLPISVAEEAIHRISAFLKT